MAVDVVVPNFRGDCMHEYHVRQQLTERGVEASAIMNYFGCGEICRMIAGLPGVRECFVNRYSVQVYKSPVYSWEEVDRSVVDALSVFDGSLEAPNG